jgi:aldehyde:ferredoxin oxidoreductase
MGPASGTVAPGSSRCHVTSRSPLNGFVGDGDVGSFFGPEMRFAGYDQIVITGRARKPCYLWVDDDDAQLVDASAMWGNADARETQEMVKEDLRDPSIQVLGIGPAGENLVRFACIMTGMGRAAGRTGNGAVMGSKKLKAIAVRGSKGVAVADPRDLEEALLEYMESIEGEKNPFYPWGTSGWSVDYNRIGALSTRNYQTGTIGPDMDGIDPSLSKKYLWSRKACSTCPMACDHLYVVDEGPYKGSTWDGLELTMWQRFGSGIGNFDVTFIYKLNEVVDRLGMDATDVGGILGLLMECFEKGILGPKDVDGLKLEWGAQEPTLKLVEMIARRNGIGNILAEGIGKAAEKLGKGAEKYAMQTKNMAFSTLDGRAVQSWGLAYAVASRGGCHMRAATADNRMTPFCHQFERKGELVSYYEHLRAIEDCLEICKFIMSRESVELCRLFEKGVAVEEAGKAYIRALARIYNAITGIGLKDSDLLRVGERVVNLERAFNVREGLTGKDDALPERWLKEPIPTGNSKGEICHLEPMLQEYYEKRGWSPKTGLPRKMTLVKLGLGDVAKDLMGQGKHLE